MKIKKKTLKKIFGFGFFNFSLKLLQNILTTLLSLKWGIQFRK